MGLGWEDFLSLTPSEYLEAKNAYIESENQKSKERWEQCRWMVFKMKTELKSVRGSGGKVSIKDVETFAWEQPDPKLQLKKASDEHIKSVIERYR